LLAIGVLVYLLNIFYGRVGYNIGSAIETFGVVRAATQFSIGAILAGMFLVAPSARRASQWFLYISSAVLLIVGMNYLESVTIPLAWAALVLAIARGDDTSGWLNHRWLIFLGDISYSTYMLHYFARDIFKLALVHADETPGVHLVAAVVLGIFVASVPVYFLVERPAHRSIIGLLKRRTPIVDAAS
jgi:peptidoglycan/LPS O-acetylase OafA/YrhL